MECCLVKRSEKKQLGIYYELGFVMYQLQNRRCHGNINELHTSHNITSIQQSACIIEHRYFVVGGAGGQLQTWI